MSGNFGWFASALFAGILVLCMIGALTLGTILYMLVRRFLRWLGVRFDKDDPDDYLGV